MTRRGERTLKRALNGGLIHKVVFHGLQPKIFDFTIFNLVL